MARDYVFTSSVCPFVRVSVRVFIYYQLISSVVGPIAAELCTHTFWMPIQNLCPTFFTWPCCSATMRPISAKHILDITPTDLVQIHNLHIPSSLEKIVFQSLQDWSVLNKMAQIMRTAWNFGEICSGKSASRWRYNRPNRILHL